MKVTGFNHLSIGTRNLAETVKFYQTVLGMETIPSYNFGFKTRYLRCGDLQLHIFELEDQVPLYQHFAVDVDDFHAAYDAAKALGALDSTTFRNPVNELPDGCVQMYLRDPAGNLIEIDWPDVGTLDRARIPEMKLLTEFAEQDQEGLAPRSISIGLISRPHDARDSEERQMANAGRKPDASVPPGPDMDQRAYAAMIGRAEALIPQLRERASRTEELRRLPPETERDLHDAGLFRIVQPKRVGGSEFDYVALVDCAEAIGRADASVAWNLANLASHHWMLGDVRQPRPGPDLGQGCQCADCLVLHLSGRPCPQGRRRIYAARQLAILLRRRFLRMEYARQRGLHRR